MPNPFFLLLCGIISCAVWSTVQPSETSTEEDTIASLKLRMEQMEENLLGKLKTMSKEHKVLSSRLSRIETDMKRDFQSSKNRENLTRTFIISHIASELEANKVFQENISSSVKTLREHDEKLIELENKQTGLTDKTSNLGSLLSKFENECSKSSDVSNLEESLQNLNRTTKAGLQSIREEVEQHKWMGELKGDVLDMQQTLRNHTSEIGSLNKQLFDIQEPCAGDPPSISNGKATGFERWDGSTVRYECDKHFIMSGNSTVRCKFGKWKGHPPSCSYLDNTLFAEAFYYSGKQYIECYFYEYPRKFEFSRLLDTGSGGFLPENATQSTYENSVKMELHGVPSPQRLGAYRCGPKADEESAEIFVPYQATGYLYFVDPHQVASVGDNVTLRLYSYYKSRPIRWFFNGDGVPSWDDKEEVLIEEVTVDHAGVYHAVYEGHENFLAIRRLVVRRCKANMYGEQCDKLCPPCYNGGICHDLLGVCGCQEGFVGSNCEKFCQVAFHGPDCTTRCYNNCFGQFHCKSDPYGCSCARGYKGPWCNERCDKGWYGADCKQQCHCDNGADSCNRMNGACEGGCVSGWKGESCQIKDAE